MTKQEYMDMYEAVGAVMEVYNQLGRGMAELLKIKFLILSI